MSIFVCIAIWAAGLGFVATLMLAFLAFFCRWLTKELEYASHEAQGTVVGVTWLVSSLIIYIVLMFYVIGAFR